MRDFLHSRAEILNQNNIKNKTIYAKLFIDYFLNHLMLSRFLEALTFVDGIKTLNHFMD